MTVTKLFIQEFGQKEFVRLSPKIRDLFLKIDSLPSASAAVRKSAPTAAKRISVKR